MFEYNATVVRVHDGDTISVDVDLGFGVWLKNQSLRLLGLNAPELISEAGKQAQTYLTGLLRPGQPVTIQTQKDHKEKYGRWLATVLIAGLNVNQNLISTGHAKPWDGQGAKPV